MKKKIIISLLIINFFLPLSVLANGTSNVLPNPMACDNLLCLFMQVIRILLGAVGIFALFVFMWGGFQMLTSAGNAEKVKQAKDTLIWASLGIIVVLASWVIIRFLMETVLSSTFT